MLACYGGIRYHSDRDAQWGAATLALVGLSMLVGFALGELPQVSTWWAAGAVVVLNFAAWSGIAAGGEMPRSASWLVASALAGVLSGATAFMLGRALSWPQVLACLVLVAIVGGAGAAAGRYVGRVTASTPAGTATAAAHDLRDCAVATVVATRDDKPTTWAALGDSYSAGVGGAVSGSPYGQDFSNAFAWSAAAQLRNPTTHEGINLKLSACSGAVVSDIFSTQDRRGTRIPLTPSAIPQPVPDSYWFGLNDALKTLKGASVVTLTIGGNDAGFGNVAKTLFADHGCGPGADCRLLADGGLANLPGDGADPRFSATTPDGEWAELSARLVNAYEVTLALMPDYGELIVVQYPLAFAEPGRECGTLRLVGARNMGLINRFAAKLDETITDAAAIAATATGRTIHVIPWGGEPPGSLVTMFAGEQRPYSVHGLCSTQPWIHGFAGAERGRTADDSFHPSTAGVLAAACHTAREVFRVQPFYKFEGFVLIPDPRCPS